MPAHVFLSPEWIEAIREIRNEYAGRVDEPAVEIAANITVTDTPFDESVVRGHVDTTGRTLVIEEGHIEHAHFGVEVTYEIAHQVFVDRDPATVMQIVLGGRVKLTGDSSRILMLAGATPPPDPDAETLGLAREILSRIDEITQITSDHDA